MLLHDDAMAPLLQQLPALASLAALLCSARAQVLLQPSSSTGPRTGIALSSSGNLWQQLASLGQSLPVPAL